MKLSAICDAVNGRLDSDSDPTVTGLTTPRDADVGALVFCIEAALVDLSIAAKPPAVMTLPKLAKRFPAGLPKIVVEDPARALTVLLTLFAKPSYYEEHIHQSAAIHPSAQLHDSVTVGPHVSIGKDCRLAAGVRVMAGAVLGERVSIGTNTIVYPNAVILDDTKIGQSSIIGPGAVVGYEGFSLDRHRLRPHIGKVEVGSDSSVGANACIDRGTIGRTLIGDSTHLDNLVQIGHNVRLENQVTICGQAGIAGSAVIGENSVIGGQAGIANGITVSRQVMLAAQSGVTKTLAVSGRYSGHPAEPNQARLRRLAKLRKLVEGDNT